MWLAKNSLVTQEVLRAQQPNYLTECYIRVSCGKGDDGKGSSQMRFYRLTFYSSSFLKKIYLRARRVLYKNTGWIAIRNSNRMLSRNS